MKRGRVNVAPFFVARSKEGLWVMGTCATPSFRYNASVSAMFLRAYALVRQ